MKRSGAVWLVVGVIAVAAVLMYFVVLPQIRDGKTVEEIARKAEETVKDVKNAVNDAGKQVEEVAEGVEEIKAAALVKMQRIGQDTKGAADEMKALFDKGTPTAEQLGAAKIKLATALKSASELNLPAEADAAAKAAATRISDGAKAALAALDKLPSDPAQAKAVLADLEAKLIAALPDGTAVKPADAVQPAVTDDGAAKRDAKPAEQKADGATETEKPADVATAVTPAFDVLRVEKDGSTVIAGRAEPGARIEIVDGGKVIASSDADPSGDFAAVLDNPLSSGDHSITIKATTKDGKSTSSEEVATVSVPKDASGELLAMVTKPGEASKIIAMPEVKDSELASNKGVTPDGSSEARTADGVATTDNAAKVQEAAEEATEADASRPDEPAKAATSADGNAAAAVDVATPDLPANSSDIASTPPTVSQDDAAGKIQEQQTAEIDPSAADAAKSADTVPQAEQKQPVAAAEVMVTAVELEGDKIYIAGTTRPGATVRLYADDQIVAEATADAGGRFVADGTIKLAVGNHTIRADVLGRDGARVEFRASVPFFRPEGDLAAVASNEAAEDKPAAEPFVNAAFDQARDEAGKALGLLQGLYAGGGMPTAEELAAARSSAEIALKSLADVRVPLDADPALATMAAKASEEAGKALDRLKAVPADVAAFKTALGEVEAIVGSAVKPAAEVANANNTVEEPAGKKTAAADQSAAANDDKPADASATAQAVDKTDGEVSSDEVQVTAKVDRLTKSMDATAKVETKADAAAEPTEGASAVTATDAGAGAGGDNAANTDETTSRETASADQPKVIEQAPLKQSDGSVIIRRGDTLWQISRRVYGRGVRYTTIYVANKTQIDDPDRIMPGQIFSMPGKWLENAEELHKERLQNGHDKP